jgi:putative SOS response-associated peptidase YedK
MCGRFTLSVSKENIGRAFSLKQVPDIVAQYNIAPTQMVGVVLHPSNADENEFHYLRWGLIPSWAKDGGMGAKLINARAETVAEKPSFRSAFKHRRCLILADGFYEWQRLEDKKQPFYFRLKDGLFGFAGLWEQWESPEAEITSCAIITTEANELMEPVHNRMPVIVAPEDYDLWLDPLQKPEPLQQLLKPYPTEKMTAYPVSTKVNNPRYNEPECILPIVE